MNIYVLSDIHGHYDVFKKMLEKIADAYEDLKVRYDKLEGELAMRKRGHYGKGSEKPFVFGSGKAKRVIPWRYTGGIQT